MKLKIFSLFSILLLVLSGCGAATDDAENNGDNTAQENQANEDTGTGDQGAADEGDTNEDQGADEDAGDTGDGGATEGSIGDTLTIEGVKITLDSVEVYEGEINQFQPLTQDHAIVANITVENTNKESYYIDSMEFTLYDAEGFELTQALPSDDMGISTELPGGKKARGTVYFDVPAQEGDWELQYKSMASWEDDAAVWRFPAK
ncbi:hypothetical protein GCM10008967_17920 [Bacillus carboniphilus]|uniref:DUF4352 domain-containing protein n=1 Tax=Bacillus carboniphilus TaxID=86663 RepID=A0ABP3FW06_9BACI